MKNISKIALSLALVLSFLISCKSSNNDNFTYVLIETKYGNMKIKLYNNTPKHKENFIKHITEGYYNDLLFHRVIKNFMIQGGDPESKNAEQGKMLGNGGLGYTIPAEFIETNFHKKGALASARLGDNMNPEKASSGSQFYIVQGKKYTEEQLVNLETNINNKKSKASYGKYLNSHPELLKQMQAFQEKGEQQKVDSILKIVQKNSDFKPTIFSAEKRKIYKEIGGTPFLDGEYTVFGEVVEGLEVIDKIAKVNKNEYDRPLEDIKMKITIISK